MKHTEKYARELAVGDNMPNRGVVTGLFNLPGGMVEVEYDPTFSQERACALKLKELELVLVTID